MSRLFGETRHVKRPRLELVPMIDVMLLLLVFYILSTVTLNRDQSIPVQLPKAKTGAPQKTVPNVTITVASDGKLYVNQKETDLSNLGKEVAALAGSDADAIKALNAKGVVINADMSVQHGKVVAVMDALREIDITHFGIATDATK